ncbi:MAG: TCR/Tet family MFS transporter [Planctomycetota bacterium]|nr:TCR/Tet family MFS transporter [Planctomycetota bacterium]
MTRRAPSLVFVFITLLLDVLGIGLIIPVAPKLVERVMGLPPDGAQSEASLAVGALAATYAAMQFLFAPILGSLSDRFGRRPVILISLFGSGVDYIVAALAPNLTILFITRALNGISGANVSACSAYIADVTPPEKRAAGFGLIGAAFGLGFILGPLLGGVLGDPEITFPFVGPGDLHFPFIAAGILTLLNWLYGCFVLPESLSPENRRPFSWRKANPLGAFLWVRRHRLVFTIGAGFFLVAIAQFGLHATWVLSMDVRFDWSARDVGWSLFTVGVTSALVQGLFSRRIIPRLGERACLIGGLVISVFAFGGYAFATQSWMIYATIIAGSLGGLASPAAQGIMSRSVPPNEQGLLHGSLSGLQSIAGVIGPLVGSAAFRSFTADTAPVYFPGAPFLAGSILTMLALVPMLIAWPRIGRTLRPGATP